MINIGNMGKISVTVEVEHGNPNIGCQICKDGEVVTFESLSAEDKQRVVRAFAGGYGLFYGHIDIEEEASEVQIR